MEKTGKNLIPLDRLGKFAAICTKIAQMADEPIKLRFDATGKGAAMCLSWGTKEIYFSEEWKDESEDTGTQRPGSAIWRKPPGSSLTIISTTT